MGHSHTSTDVDYGQPRRLLASALALVVLGIAAAAIAGMIVLWPDADTVPRGENPYAGEGVTTVSGEVVRVQPFDCDSGGEGPDQQPSVSGDCAKVTASTGDDQATFNLDPGRYRAGIEVGDDVRMIRIQPAGEAASYEFLDFKRGCH